MPTHGDILARLTALENTIRQMVRLGFVIDQVPAEGAVRVEIRDADCLQTYKLPVLYPKTRADKFWWLPELGEHVLCVFLPIGMEIGFVLGAIYSAVDTPPAAEPGKALLHFEDGTWLEYDKATGEMQIHCREKLTLAAPAVEIKAQTIKQPVPIIQAGEPDLKPIVPAPLPEPEEWPYV